MRIIKQMFILAAISAVLVSCTEEFEVNVNAADTQIVVEANLNNKEPITVTLSSSVNFKDDNEFPPVVGATIVITDNLGNNETLKETSKGKYVGSTVIGIAGRSYTLNIKSNDKIISSECTISNEVNFDKLTVKVSSGGGGGGPGGGDGSTHDISVEYLDPLNETNYYRFVEFKNGDYIDAYIFDDRLSNGTTINSTLRSFNRNYKKGDTLTIEMQCISKEIYEYYKSFGNLFGGPTNASTPANPYTNMLGTRLGYFSAHTIQTKIFIIP
ncbi:MAG: DUF4249 domain-containing protein [Saprospiraceae bacterium]|nr:DUF4249 domain-containing protein [Saprospiraceae bacterium]